MPYLCIIPFAHMTEFRQRSGVFVKAILFLNNRIGLLIFIFVSITSPPQQDFCNFKLRKTMLNATAAGKGSLPNVFQQRHNIGYMEIVVYQQRVIKRSLLHQVIYQSSFDIIVSKKLYKRNRYKYL